MQPRARIVCFAAPEDLSIHNELIYALNRQTICSLLSHVKVPARCFIQAVEGINISFFLISRRFSCLSVIISVHRISLPGYRRNHLQRSQASQKPHPTCPPKTTISLFKFWGHACKIPFSPSSHPHPPGTRRKRGGEDSRGSISRCLLTSPSIAILPGFRALPVRLPISASFSSHFPHSMLLKLNHANRFWISILFFSARASPHQKQRISVHCNVNEKKPLVDGPKHKSIQPRTDVLSIASFTCISRFFFNLLGYRGVGLGTGRNACLFL
jgi:hypothetical protein